MDFRILDTTFTQIDTLDQYESIIWTTRFFDAGEFELYTPINQRLLSCISIGYYLFSDEFYNDQTQRAILMIVESMEITSDPENGNKIKITGRDLKSFLDRRIIWGQITFKTNDRLIDDVILPLLNNNAINPPNWHKEYQKGDGGIINIDVLGENRKIPNLIYESSNIESPLIDGDYQYNGETLYDVFVDLFTRFNLGWDVLYDFSNGKFIFKIRSEEDHTYPDDGYPINNPLIFSPKFENLRNSNYIESSVTEKNSGLITGEGDENNVMYNTIGETISGLNRREMSISASDISRKEEDGTVYSNEQYLSMIKTKGENELAQNIYTQTYEGTAEYVRGYHYPEDYDIGYICEIINEWGLTSKVLISEIVLSISTNEVSVIPTFSAIDQ